MGSRFFWGGGGCAKQVSSHKSCKLVPISVIPSAHHKAGLHAHIIKQKWVWPSRHESNRHTELSHLLATLFWEAWPKSRSQPTAKANKNQTLDLPQPRSIEKISEITPKRPLRKAKHNKSPEKKKGLYV